VSLYGIHKALYLLQNDLAFRERLRTDPVAALADLPLDDHERRALLAGDVAELYRLGVHTFLMSRMPRFNVLGLTREEYQRRLSGVGPRDAEPARSSGTPTGAQRLYTTVEHVAHAGVLDHAHGPGCGHAAVQHAGQHVDYLVDGHAHHAHEGHWDECDPAALRAT
jgi:hypothetical protein